MEQLELFEIEAGPRGRIELEESLRNELITFMAEIVMAVIRAESEVKDEPVKSEDSP